MKNKKEYMIIFVTVAALLIDILGREFAVKFVLPVWTDSIGTFLVAYLYGPVCGAFVGFTNNIIYGIFVEQELIYCVVGSMLGIIVGIYSKKRVFDKQFTTMTLGMGLALFSTVMAVMVNALLYSGNISNVWGNQVMLLCVDKGLPKFISYIAGQFCVEFMDKILTVEIMYLLLKIAHYIRKKLNKRFKTITQIIILAVVMAGVCCGKTEKTAAAQNKSVQTSKAGYTSETKAGKVSKANSENNKSEYKSEYKSELYSYIQKQYSKDEGLLSGEANDIAQTKDGKLWIGTYAGLFKYDGVKFVCFQDISSVKSVNCLYVDEEGRLWVGTNDNGVTIFINEDAVNVVDDQNGLLSNSVKKIVCDSHGNYYIGTSEALSVVSLSGGVKVTKTFKNIKNVVSMTADDNGNVAGVTERGEMFWISDGKLINTPKAVSKFKDCNEVYFSKAGQLYIGTTGNSIYIFDMESKKLKLKDKIRISGFESINYFYQADNDKMFVCSDTGVAVLGKNGSYYKINTNNFNSSIDSMLVDYQGNLWFSSSRLGLLEMCKSSFEEIFQNIGMTAVVNSTEKWDGMLFCGTDDGLVAVKGRKKVSNQLTKRLQNVRIRCLKADSKNTLWIATTEMGIYKVTINKNGGYDIKNFTDKQGIPGMRFRNIIECSDGRIVIAGDYGVAIMSGDRVVNVLDSKDGMLNEKSLCLLEHKDACYVGSDGGGITKIDKNGKVTQITKKDGLSSDVVLRMVSETVYGGMFIVTSNGLCYMSKDGKVKSLDKFPYSNNYDIVCNKNGICWVLGSAGIYEAKIKELIKNVRSDYLLINSKHGLRASLVANSWPCRESGALYLCCDTGVVKVNMSDGSKGDDSYRMIMNYVEIDGEKVAIDRIDTLKMSADSRQITFAPEILNYSVKDPYISVKLEGHDTKRRTCLLSEFNKITYTDLKTGRYVFKISILDGYDGNVIESGSYIIDKENEMYQYWWFKFYICIIAGLVLIWLTWFITRTCMQRTMLKQKLELEYAKKQIKMSNETILSIARTVDAKDSNTSQHSYRVSEYSVAIAKRLGFSDEKCENLRKMALLHDIGKIGIPDAILNKPAKLTDEEYKIMKTHVTLGADILKDFTLIDNVNIGALYHHEKYDGTGYCYGLKGEDIPIEARIIGIADAFDAMTANRVYRKQLDIDYVTNELKRCSGTQFDPKLVKIMLSLMDEGIIDVESLYARSKGETEE